jgi:DNA invertase Pin-like site-specific DNA recombinase
MRAKKVGKKNPNHKIGESVRRQITQMHVDEESAAYISRMTGVNVGSVYRIIHGKQGGVLTPMW